MTVSPEGDDMDDDDLRQRPRTDGSRQWEVFYHDVPTKSMRYVGSVSAPSGDLATEQARTLFGSDDADLWLVPTDELLQLDRNDLAAEGEESTDGAEHDGMEHDGVGDVRGAENGMPAE